MCLQISVEAPWLSNIQASCVVISQGMLTCVDSATVSLYMLDLHMQSEMTQIPLQVPAKIKPKLSCEPYPLVWDGLHFSLIYLHFSAYTMEPSVFIPTSFSLCKCFSLCFTVWYHLSSSSHWDLKLPLASIQSWCPPSPTQPSSRCQSSSFSSGLNITCFSSSTMDR